LKKKFTFDRDAEITVECNPGTLTADKLRIYRQAGINRLSIGLQSAQEEELRLLGRIHTWEDFLESFRLARQAGFGNINVDLMSALPGQRLAIWRDTLEKVLALAPEHISAYSLIIEEGTPFYGRYQEDARRRERG
ncbi:radical SAM protein, partial [Parabacteroides distasonis]